MAKPSRPQYGGIPARAEADIAARRQRAADIEAAPPSPAPRPPPALIETRLKAIEDKVDLIIEILQAGTSDAAPRKPASKQKRLL